MDSRETARRHNPKTKGNPVKSCHASPDRSDGRSVRRGASDDLVTDEQYESGHGPVPMASKGYLDCPTVEFLPSTPRRITDVTVGVVLHHLNGIERLEEEPNRLGWCTPAMARTTVEGGSQVVDR